MIDSFALHNTIHTAVMTKSYKMNGKYEYHPVFLRIFVINYKSQHDEYHKNKRPPPINAPSKIGPQKRSFSTF